MGAGNPLPLSFRRKKMFLCFFLATGGIERYHNGVGYRRQLSLFPEMKFPLAHGGELSKGKRKTARPFDPKRSMHVVLRMSSAAMAGKAKPSLLLYGGYIRSLLRAFSQRLGVRIYEQAIISNHLHLVTHTRDRVGFGQFLMALSGRIAQRVTGAKKGTPLKEKFWATIPWSRIVEWGRALITATKYTRQNVLESTGIISYTPRKCKALNTS